MEIDNNNNEGCDDCWLVDGAGTQVRVYDFLIAVERFAQCVLLVVFAVVGLLTSSEGVHEERWYVWLLTYVKS